MTADDFRAWLERRALTYYRAAPLLAADESEVSRWARGERKVPRRIARIVELLDENDRLRKQRNFHMQEARKNEPPGY